MSILGEKKLRNTGKLMGCMLIIALGLDLRQLLRNVGFFWLCPEFLSMCSRQKSGSLRRKKKGTSNLQSWWRKRYPQLHCACLFLMLISLVHRFRKTNIEADDLTALWHWVWLLIIRMVTWRLDMYNMTMMIYSLFSQCSLFLSQNPKAGVSA